MSILNNDLYKFTMQQAVLDLYPKAHAVYKFINRRPSDKFNPDAIQGIKRDIESLKYQALEYPEKCWLQDTCPYLKTSYLEYLSNYRYNPNEVRLTEEDGNLGITIDGLWSRTILWEVPLLSIVSENYFKYVDTNWTKEGQDEKAKNKAIKLAKRGCKFADFGTRRRRNMETQDGFVKSAKEVAPDHFLGTSNVHLAHKYNVKPVGTLAHEWFMGISALRGIRHANQYALEDWMKVYHGNLGIALTDTFGTQTFFNDFNPALARMYDGIRQDSGNPFEFVDFAVAKYADLGIEPTFKTIVFSDNLDVDKAIKLQEYCNNYQINCSFGIGTNFSNDFENSKALNIVIKLTEMNAIPVVKLSDDAGKEIGTKDALKVVKWILFGVPLNEN